MNALKHKWRNGLILAALLAVVSVPACTQGPPAEIEPREVRSEVERGPVCVAVQVEPAQATLSDRPRMTLTFDYVQGVTVEQPEFAEAIGDLRILEVEQIEPRVQDDREVVEQIFTLEPTKTGKMPIFPVNVYFKDTRPDGDGKEHMIETEQLAIDVGSVVEGEVNSLDQLQAAAPPVALPWAIPWPVVLAVVLVLILAGGGLAWWLRKRHHKVVQARILTPQERAILELEKLWESDLAHQDSKLYYVELTGIVRRYIEVTTGIRAPEQTTEEFLHEIAQRDTFAPEDRRRFKSFLEAADLVKFAAHKPREEDIEASYQRAREFVGCETPQEVLV